MRRRVVLTLLFAAASVVGACKEDEPRPPPASDSTTTPGGGAAGGAGSPTDGGLADGDAALDGSDAEAGAACNALALDGDLVDQQRVVDDPPLAQGGTIVDGTYELIEALVYVGAGGVSGPTGTSVRGAVRVAQGTLERAHLLQPSGGGPSQTVRVSGPYTTGTTTLSFGVRCPAPAQEQLTYSVVGEQLVLTDTVTKESFTYTLR